MEALAIAAITAALSALAGALRWRAMQRKHQAASAAPAILNTPNVRLDAAHVQVAAHSRAARRRTAVTVTSRATANATHPAIVHSRESWQDDSDVAFDDHREDYRDADFADADLNEPQTDETPVGTEDPAQSTSLFSSAELLALRIWTLAGGWLVAQTLLLPIWVAGLTQLNVLLVPIVTSLLALVCPIPRSWAASAVGVLHAGNFAGYWLAGGALVAGDLSFCATLYLANVAAVVFVATFTFRR